MGTPKNESGIPYHMAIPRTGTELILATHNFADSTTWYTASAREVDVIMTGSIDNLTFSCQKDSWIDMTHGKTFDEDTVKLSAEHQYSVVVTVNGNLNYEREPFETSGGDYVVDYTNGKILFFSEVTGSVIASFSYASGSTWIIKPDAGTMIVIEEVEAQFSDDIIMNDTIEFHTWVYNPYDVPNKVMINKTCYKRVINLVDEALGSYPVIKSFGGPSRGINSDIYGFPFRYGTVKLMRSSQGTELRVKLQKDRLFSGSYATATFYCTVHDEES